MKYKIQLATDEDIEEIIRLLYNRCIWFKENDIFGWDMYYTERYDEKYFKKQLKTNKLFVIKEEKKICGVMLLKEEDNYYWSDNEPSYYIHHLATDINKKGLGKLLIEFAKEQCKKDNKKCLRGDCYRENFYLNEYYAKLGFHIVGSGTIEDYEGDYNYNLLEMKVL